MKNLASRFLADESGATSIEYALIASLVAVAIVAASSTIGKNVGNSLNRVAKQL